jgi:hypothetical protein
MNNLDLERFKDFAKKLVIAKEEAISKMQHVERIYDLNESLTKFYNESLLQYTTFIEMEKFRNSENLEFFEELERLAKSQNVYDGLVDSETNAEFSMS